MQRVFYLKHLIWAAFLLGPLAAGALSAARGDETAHPTSALIDREIEAALAEKKLVPAPPAEEADLVRRLYLDILGRIPTAAEVQQHQADAAPDKHHRLIDGLLAHEELPAYWRTVLDDWFNGGLRERDFGRDGFLDYLEMSLRTNKPWNRLAREMLAPDLRDESQRRAAYFLAVRVRGGDNDAKLDALASGVASVLFGVQLQCAKCHDHPFVEQWKQDHYYGLAAFLGRTQEARLDNTPIVRERAEGEVKFITTAQEEKTAKLMFLDSRVLEEPAPPSDRSQWYAKAEGGLPEAPYFSRRAVLADYALSADSRFFKRALVNRVWKQFLGRGLVEPVDQMHDANPASHPALLEKLADDFAASGFDLRRLMAGILHSRTYLRSSRWPAAGERPRESDYAVALLKPLTGDQLALSIGLASGHYDQQLAKFEREKKSRKVDQVTPALARAWYWKEREVQDFSARFRAGGEQFESHASHALFLSYNNLMQKQLQPGGGNLLERLVKQKDDPQAVRDAFLTVLARAPTEEELRRGCDFVAGDAPQRPARLRELAWALLCSSEFRFNH